MLFSMRVFEGDTRPLLNTFMMIKSFCELLTDKLDPPSQHQTLFMWQYSWKNPAHTTLSQPDPLERHVILFILLGSLQLLRSPPTLHPPADNRGSLLGQKPGSSLEGAPDPLMLQPFAFMSQSDHFTRLTIKRKSSSDDYNAPLTGRLNNIIPVTKNTSTMPHWITRDTSTPWI